MESINSRWFSTVGRKVLFETHLVLQQQRYKRRYMAMHGQRTGGNDSGVINYTKPKKRQGNPPRQIGMVDDGRHRYQRGKWQVANGLIRGTGMGLE